MGWSCSLPGDYRQTVAGGARLHVGLAVGRDLLLWNMLVACVPDDPLCPYFRPAGLSTFIATNFGCRALLCFLQLVAIATRRQVWRPGDPGRAALMGHV